MPSITETKRQLIDYWRGEGFPEHLLKAFAMVPREEFVPEEMRGMAYLDQPLHIGHNQTISQPTTIMTMLKLLDVSPKQKILEIGSGSGYVTALLSAIGCIIIGIEIVPELVVRSARTIEKLGFSNQVSFHAADGGGGWEEDAPYDRILFSAAVPEVPRHVFWQLKKGGMLVAPVGVVEQRMTLCRKNDEDDVTEEDHGAYIFVPLTGKFSEERNRGDDLLPDLPFT